MDRIERLKKRETRLVTKGKKAVDEGRDKKADRILGRAAKTENRIIKLEEKKKKYLPEGRRGGAVPKGYHKMPNGEIMKDSAHKMKKGSAVLKKAQKGGQPSDSTAWKNRTLPNLTKQGLDYEIGRLSKMVTPKSAPSVIQQKIDMLKREKIRRATVKKVTTNKKK